MPSCSLVKGKPAEFHAALIGRLLRLRPPRRDEPISKISEMNYWDHLNRSFLGSAFILPNE